MKTIICFIKRVIFAVFPFIHSCIANRKIEKQLDNHGDLEIAQPLNVLRAEYERSLKGKDKLEDKAKSNIVAITIAITLIMGASNTISGLLKNPLWFWMPAIAVLLFVVAVIYMIIAGTSAFKLLMDKNVVYYAKADTDDIKDYYINKEGNNKYNLIRNNLINTSFCCIRNALICLFIVFTLTLINQFEFADSITASSMTQFSNTRIYYSNSILQNKNSEKLRLTAEDLIHNYYDLGKLKVGEYTGLIDPQNKVFVKVIRQSDEIICVMSIESFIQ
ncbi:hypothetical protein LY28_03698 [Ruminiclostridium sufflavum DSM 19573]|uniref:Uncharacterized protein n=1 Tax=Ruminiclostridium sufflavum DSM 19573 TaxID=1121337 RepID=A0A318XFE3_9FIRM|nr:hypothetical protein [Ruminiclostridium sufflavum]PYG84278.1 hypothetical protein LY28_03698 [Ruminiclostridium sufflavum DSM 19573]